MSSLTSCLYLLLFVPAIDLDSFHDQIFPSDRFVEEKDSYSWSNGSHVFTLHPDHTFSLRPTGISGRTISGWWKFNRDGCCVVVGKWSWINGVSRDDDYRKMELDVRVENTTVTSEGDQDGFDRKSLHSPIWNVEYLAPVDHDEYSAWEKRYTGWEKIDSDKPTKSK